MPCSQCQHATRAGLQFCTQCGTPLAGHCAACGVTNPPGSTFCGACGTALTAPVPVTGLAPPAPRGGVAEVRFYALVSEAIALLQRERWVTYRRLQYVFGIDEVLLTNGVSLIRNIQSTS